MFRIEKVIRRKGVVQGSGIGPMMFLIFIDELANLSECRGVTTKLFADDVKVYLIITSVDDVAKLQAYFRNTIAIKTCRKIGS